MAPLLALALLPSVAEAQTQTSTSTPLTTDVKKEGEASLDIPRLLLNIPQAFVELVLSPLKPIALAFERYHLLPRLIDLITNDAKTLAIIPVIDPFNNSGLGFGAVLLHNDPFGSQDRIIVSGNVRLNGDRQISMSVAQRLPALSGRVFRFSAAYEADQDTRYFGLGGESQSEDVRRLRTDRIAVSTGIDILQGDWDMRVSVAYRRRKLSTGKSPQDPVLVLSDSTLPTNFLPPDFDQVFDRFLDYPEATFSFGYDSRDALGRTTRGFQANIEVSVSHDLNGANTGGISTAAAIGAFIPILPRNRTLYLALGAEAAVPFMVGDEVPLHQLVRFGGSSTLRGYVGDRFLDRLGWWGTAEYRYRFYEYGGTGQTLSAVLFTDVGKVGRNPIDLVKGPIAYSVGLGLRAEHNLFLAGRVQFAVSPDGFRFSIGFGEVL